MLNVEREKSLDYFVTSLTQAMPINSTNLSSSKNAPWNSPKEAFIGFFLNAPLEAFLGPVFKGHFRGHKLPPPLKTPTYKSFVRFTTPE